MQAGSRTGRKMVRSKCRIKLDGLNLSSRSPRKVETDAVDGEKKEQESVRVEGTTENERVTEDAQQESVRVEGTTENERVTEDTQQESVRVEGTTENERVTKDAQQVPVAVPKNDSLKSKRVESPYLPRKLKCRIVLDGTILRRLGSPLSTPRGSDVVDRREEVRVERESGSGLEVKQEEVSVCTATTEAAALRPVGEIIENVVPSLDTSPVPVTGGSASNSEGNIEDGAKVNELKVEPEIVTTPARSSTVNQRESQSKQLNVTPDDDERPSTSTSAREKFRTPVGFSKIKFLEDEEDKEDDITGSILELEQDEISTPKGPRKGKLPKSPNFPHNRFWVKPEDLLEELWVKKRCLRSADDDEREFVFPNDPSIVLTPHSWQLSELMNLKRELNEVKSTIDHLPLEHWHSHTKKMNIANSIVSHVKRYFNPEFSSQAWGKMFEILCAHEVVPQKVLDEMDAIFENEERTAAGEKVPFDTVHLCEAPGAFISALNHFLKISYSKIDWNWLATTLNPYHENNDVGKMINDDRLILKTLDKWTFLDDKTGNILTIPNINRLIKDKESKLDNVRETTSGGKQSNVLLVTADGSIDCQTNPGEQESMVSHLQYGEILAALMILQEGGSFILKIFTFLEAVTICHLYLLSCVFKEVHLFKPATSKEGNSEVYVVCLNYLGKKSIEPILEAKLFPSLETYDKMLKEGKLLLPFSAIPKFFITRIKEAANFFCNYQMKIIRRNESCFPCDDRIYSIMKPFRKEAAELWIEWTEIQVLPAQQRLFIGEDFKFNKASHLDIKKEVGCFMDKVRRMEGPDLQKILAIKVELMSYDHTRSAANQVIYGEKFKVGPIEFEKPYKNIRCSRFCYGRVLSIREEIREIVNRYLFDLQAQGLGSMENVCSGHSVKRIYESMAKSCDVLQKNLDVLCFNKLTWDYITKTDFQQQKEDLNRLFQAVKDVGKDRSLFLCRFPLLTRLQTGIIFCLASVFEKITIYMDPVKNVVGVMLHKYQEVSKPEHKNMFRCLTDVLKVLKDNEFDWPVLQIVPMKTLLEFMPSEFLVRYNILLLCQDMLRTVNVVHCMIQSNGTIQATKKPTMM